eukprot:CAMPEP_0198197882 /NCGR_PEP_ID=MMETSP1445-20131203/1453_1 /TAXON_ID=36898 /ORGANISM="Pyramimonas sp., Strain CCMP2087" /LENGTH=319 /DNA_ID=CAMNT_0043867293 /DNA_START=425 /DNA_END=1384 /DNA_ORIENTATION=-
MRQRLQHKKRTRGTEEEEDNIEEDHCEDDTGRRVDLHAFAWIVVCVNGDAIRHLKPDERSIAAVLRHFLYDKECAGKEHSSLLGSKDYTRAAGWDGLLAERTEDVNVCSRSGASSANQGPPSTASRDTDATNGSHVAWHALPTKKCCKGITYSRVASLQSVIPESRSVITSPSPKIRTGLAKGDPPQTASGQEEEEEAYRHVSSPPPLEEASPIPLPIGVHMTYKLELTVPPFTLQDITKLLQQQGCRGAAPGCISEPPPVVVGNFVMGDDVGFMAEDDALCSALGCAPISLGTGMLLTSHCITILNHYMDMALKDTTG